MSRVRELMLLDDSVRTEQVPSALLTQGGDLMVLPSFLQPLTSWLVSKSPFCEADTLTLCFIMDFLVYRKAFE